MKFDREICIVLRVLSSFRHIGDRLDCEVYLRQHRFSSFNLSVEDRMSSISVISGHSKYISVSINRKPPFLTEDIPRKFSKIQHENMRTIQTKKIIVPPGFLSSGLAQSFALQIRILKIITYET